MTDRNIKKMLPVLAPAFNALMGIAEGFFGSSPKRQSVSPGQQRAMLVVQANREAHRERLSGTAMPGFPSTRQARRARQRALDKATTDTPVKAAAMRMAAFNKERELRRQEAAALKRKAATLA